MSDKLLREYLKEAIAESRVREAEITSGESVPWGDERHITDLEMRIAELMRWRDKQRKGSEHRALYSRLISRLKMELTSAKHAAQKERGKMED
jgi:hypothetical protein